MTLHPRKIANSLLLLVIYIVSGCAPTSAPLPPGVPEAALSTVYFYSAKGIDTSEMAVDGVAQGNFAMGIRVPPGSHEATCSYTLEDEKCYWGDYCFDTTYYGTCTARFQSGSGKKYSVKLTRSSSTVFVSVVDSETEEVLGSGKCETTRSAPHSTKTR